MLFPCSHYSAQMGTEMQAVRSVYTNDDELDVTLCTTLIIPIEHQCLNHIIPNNFAGTQNTVRHQLLFTAKDLFACT